MGGSRCGGNTLGPGFPRPREGRSPLDSRVRGKDGGPWIPAGLRRFREERKEACREQLSGQAFRKLGNKDSNLN